MPSEWELVILMMFMMLSLMECHTWVYEPPKTLHMLLSCLILTNILGDMHDHPQNTGGKRGPREVL